MLDMINLCLLGESVAPAIVDEPFGMEEQQNMLA